MGLYEIIDKIGFKKVLGKQINNERTLTVQLKNNVIIQILDNNVKILHGVNLIPEREYSFEEITKLLSSIIS